jgi:hypothetical protein
MKRARDKSNRGKLPRINSIRKLARFWDSHDLTDFRRELQKVTEPVFAQCEFKSIGKSPTQALPAPSGRNPRHCEEAARYSRLKSARLSNRWHS